MQKLTQLFLLTIGATSLSFAELTRDTNGRIQLGRGSLPEGETSSVAVSEPQESGAVATPASTAEPVAAATPTPVAEPAKQKPSEAKKHKKKSGSKDKKSKSEKKKDKAKKKHQKKKKQN